MAAAAAVRELPEELIWTSILTKLPVKSLLRFKCVRKSWYTLIESPNFINLHLVNNSSNDCFIVRRCYQTQPPLRRHALSFHSSETLAADLGIDELVTPFTKQTEAVCVSGPCNGLICIANNNDQIFICNPSTREFRSLFVPPAFGYRSGYHYDTVAFGFDPNSSSSSSCGYKVVMIGVYYDNSDHYDPELEELYERDPSYRGVREAMVYDFSTDSWRDTTAGGEVVPKMNCFPFSHVAVSLNGAFHWTPFVGLDWILSFLISDEVTKEIPLPEFYSAGQGERRQRDLCVMNNSLALVVYSHPSLEISVMTEYGVKESWTKLFQLGPFPCVFIPMAFWKNLNGHDHLILDTAQPGSDTSQLVSCDLQHQNITHFPIDGLLPILSLLEYSLDSPRAQASFDVFLYSESLVSVNGLGRGEYAA